MLNILVIDDEPIVTRDMINMFGYDVQTANDGFEGIQRFNDDNHRYDLLILDINMPKLNGWNTLKYIRNGEHRPDVPIIMLSSSNEESNVIAGLRRGADEYLTKPISPGKLLAHIEALSRRTQWESKAAKKMHDPEEEKLRASFGLLTQREQELLTYVAKGFSNSKIGKTLSISETTVKNHLAHIFKKLKVSNRTQAAYVAQRLQAI